MNVVYLITGSGDSFYCANCFRDMLYLRAIRNVPNTNAKAVPLYLPPNESINEPGLEHEVFFGAITMYLRDKVKILKNMSAKWDRILNSKSLLKIASGMSGSTDTRGLEDMTLNMISGDNAFRTEEVERLITYLSRDESPNVIHLSNSLIIGLAKHIKRGNASIKVVCSLLNEDDWIEDMQEPYRSKAWQLIGEEAQYINRFVTPSNYYKNFFVSKTGVDPSKIDVVPIGFVPDDIKIERQVKESQSIGFFCRMDYYNGFNNIIDAFIKLKEEYRFDKLTLRACGGYTNEDKPFINEQMKKIKKHGLSDQVRIYQEFTGNEKAEFFNAVDIISVPVNKYDGYGLYVLEANSTGKPVVLPAVGAFPEIVANTGGGVTYTPNTTDELAKTLANMLKDKDKQRQLGDIGKQSVAEKFTIEEMSKGLMNVYDHCWD